MARTRGRSRRSHPRPTTPARRASSSIPGSGRPANGPGTESFPKTERTFLVRSYRVPRIKGDVALDRDSYGPGDAGVATFSIERAEGGVPVGAKLDATVSVDGREVAKETQILAAS